MSGTRFLLDGRAVAAADAVLGAETGLVRSGEGWFETLRGEQGRWMFESQHLARLKRGVAAAGLDAESALQAARATLQAASIDAARPARLRLLVTPSPAGEWGWQSLGELSDYAPPEPLYSMGMVLRSAASEHPGLGELGKSASYHWSQFAQREAERAGADEALFWRAGLVAEGARSTLLWREGSRWWTPDTGGLLASVTLAALEAGGLEVARGSLDASRLAACEGLVLVSALRLAAPVRSLDGRALPLLADEAAALRTLLLSLHERSR
jgi:4-amino-4-deoxychorismate lyase